MVEGALLLPIETPEKNSEAWGTYHTLFIWESFDKLNTRNASTIFEATNSYLHCILLCQQPYSPNKGVFI